MTSSTDHAILLACLDGDEKAWRRLVERHGALVRAAGRAVVRDEDLADEIFVETFARLAENLSQLRQPVRLRAWLVTTARRLGIDALRRRGRDVELGEKVTEIPDGTWRADEELERLQESARVHDALARLGERCRRLLEKLYLAAPRPSYEEIGRALGMPIGSIGPTRARCLEKLRTIYLERTGS